jgi:uncharacterized protein (TIGR00255 family)
MTGSGTHAVDAPTGRFETEARAVNHRFLKVTARAHGPLPSITELVEGSVRPHVRRGHVTVHVRFRPAAPTDFADRIHDEAFGAAARRLTELATRHDLGPVTAADVLGIPGVLADQRADGDDDALRADVRRAVEGVVAELQASRTREGEALAREIIALLEAIEAGVRAIAARAEEVPVAYRARLEKRLGELLEGTGHAPDPAQVARECALMAERSDIREEIARLAAHGEHARALLAEGGAIGRRLDFLAQEFHREANTIASKTSDLALARTVLDLRADVERLREQVQNVE